MPRARRRQVLSVFATWRLPLIRVSCFAAVVALTSPAAAQWSPWADAGFDNRRGSRERDSLDQVPERRAPASRDAVHQGGARPAVPPQAPPVVAFPYDYAPESIVIDTSGRRLYYVLPEGRAYEYPISVGREGFNWTGSETVSRKQEWPDWYPPVEMRQRDPRLPEKMTGGIRNPLGAVALYLGNTLYRIHGTNDVKSIGQAQSSGCFRMMNPAVVHLASLVEVGTQVSVVAELARLPRVSSETAQGPMPSSERRELGPQAPGMPSSARDYRALREYTIGR